MTHIYVVQMDIPAELEAEFNRIYDEDHVPTILKVPGVRSCRRYRLEHSTVPSMPRYLAIYECDNAEVINSPAWIEASDTGEWKPKIRPHTYKPPALNLPSDRLIPALHNCWKHSRGGIRDAASFYGSTRCSW